MLFSTISISCYVPSHPESRKCHWCKSHQLLLVPPVNGSSFLGGYCYDHAALDQIPTANSVLLSWFRPSVNFLFLGPRIWILMSFWTWPVLLPCVRPTCWCLARPLTHAFGIFMQWRFTECFPNTNPMIYVTMLLFYCLYCLLFTSLYIWSISILNINMYLLQV
jgi:hypothetical protein